MSVDDRLLAGDAEARARALEPASFVVEAPAGAGKTELLTQRVLRLLAEVDSPEEIVAITFTNKAAAEMRARILESLDAARAGKIPEAPHKRITFELARRALAASERLGWGLMDHPGRLRVTTIDALCASLARQMPVLSRFGAQPRIAEKPERHYEEAARRTLGLLHEEGEEAEAVAEALRHFDNDTPALSRLLAQTLGRRDQWLRHALNHGPSGESARGLAELVRRDLVAVEGALGPALQARLMPLARHAAVNLVPDSSLAALADWTKPLAAAPEDLPRWRAVCELLLTKEGEARRQVNKNNGFPAGKEGKAAKDAMTEFLAELAGLDAAAIARIRALPDPGYTEEEWRAVDALAKLLKLAAAQLWSVFLEAGEADFVEVAQRALEALGGAGEPSELALRLDYRLRHLLVDEFQDTSPVQVELLRRLTAGWMPDDGRTLFLVGDPMQSIYRFREADVGLFLQVAELGIGGVRLERLRLARNNRSAPPVVDWVNAVFPKVFPAGDSVAAGAIAYRDFAATRDALPGAGVFVDPVVVEREDRNKEDSGGAEARRMLEIIDRERAAGHSVAVLVRAREHLAALVAEIRRHRPDLAFRAVEIERLAARQPVQDLVALTRALLHRADRVNWLAVLRAPWCGLSLADLHTLAADDHASTVWSLMNDDARVARLSADGQARLGHLRGALAAAFAERGRVRFARWIEGAWLALGGAGCLRDAVDAADARACLDLIDRLDAAGRFSLDRIEADLDELYAAPDAAADGSLQFMTIHKSKGLEFDTVILPGLHRKGRDIDAPLMRWEEVALEGTDECLVAAPVRRRGSRRGDGRPSPYDYIGQLERERAANEAGRLLYVAATRAVRSLHLVGVATRKTDGEIAPPSGSFLALLWPAVAAEFAAAEAATDTAISPGGPAIDPAAFVPRLVRAASPAVPEPLRAAPLPAPAPEAHEAAGGGEPFCDPLDAGVGTLVHACLETVAKDGPQAWAPARVEALLPALRVRLTQMGFAPADAARGADRARAALAATLESEKGRWVLARREEAAVELVLSSADADGIAHHVVDRCFVEDGVRWIVDYKTASVEEGEAELCAHAERYRPQLERYAALFRQEGLPIRMGIFYAALGRWVELEA